MTKLNPTPRLANRLRRVFHSIENDLDRGRRYLTRRQGRRRPLRIVPYRGYGSQTHFFLMGRVIENRRLGIPDPKDGWWDNLSAMYHRFESDEVPGATVRLTVEDRQFDAVTDGEGYFRFAVRFSGRRPTQSSWRKFPLRLVGENADGSGQETAHVLTPPFESSFGIISDIDDTVLKTQVTEFVQMLRITLTGNAHTRMPFPGVAAFYRALHNGLTAADRNPIFYVSGSAWNLYDLLYDFMELNDLPGGPLLLRDYGLDSDQWITGDMRHKIKEIRRILRTYPHLPFILVGDTGELDAEIYQQVVQEFPGRILSIYLRGTGGIPDERALRIAQRLTAEGVDALVVADTVAAARHAAEKRLIVPAAVDAVGLDCARDRSPSGH